MENKSKIQFLRELNIKGIAIKLFIVLIVIAVIVLVSLYIAEESFRNWVDINILQKEIETENIASIDLETEKNNQVICYYKYIGVLNEKILQVYNQSGTNITEMMIEINTAIYNSCEKYLVIAEDGGQKICVISDQTYLWNTSVDGEITQVYINKNGYVAVVTKDTTYSAIITLYDSDGKQLLKNYLSTTNVIDVAISSDNKYLAFAEMDTSGTLIQSNIKIISVEEAQKNSGDAIIYTKQADISKMILNIHYQDKGELVCIYNDSINIISNNEENELLEIDDETTFISSHLSNRIAYIKEETTEESDYNSTLYIVNPSNNQIYTYHIDEVAKEMYTYGNVIGVNIGTEIYFISSNGTLIKKYTSSQEITNVVLSNEIAIIIYKDRIEIINL